MARLWQTWLTFRHWALSTMRELYDDPELKALLRPEVIWEIEGGFDMCAFRVTEAATARAVWYQALHKLFESYDILMLPTAQVFPFDKTIHWPKTVAGREMDTYHRWMEIVILGSLAGIPVINIPVGFDNQGRPMGMQVMGNFGEDKKVLEFGLAYDQITDFLQQRPEMMEA